MPKPYKRQIRTSMMADDLRLMPNHRCYRPDQDPSSATPSSSGSKPITVAIDPVDPSVLHTETPFKTDSTQLFVNGVCYFANELDFPGEVNGVGYTISIDIIEPGDDIRLLAIPA